jgi:acyl-CoA hydrolase
MCAALVCASKVVQACVLVVRYDQVIWTGPVFGGDIAHEMHLNGVLAGLLLAPD